MLYLIKSIKWTKHNKKDTYWQPDENGYTFVIANAGFYKAEEAEKIVKLSSGNAEMIPITKEILDKAHRQLKRLRKEILKDRELEDIRHNNVYEDLDKRDDAADKGHSRLNDIAEQLGI
ncbi:MAG: hypothetical protein UHN47_03800 [Lachnospiraceae bacterium]|nr:hypothetical protein [Lachnospiraceae bacterium]